MRIPPEKLSAVNSVLWRYVRKEFAGRPLSALGSVMTMGGRANPGAYAVLGSRASQFAALYLADSPTTARCEVTGETQTLEFGGPGTVEPLSGFVLFPVQAQVDRVLDCTNPVVVSFLAQELQVSESAIESALAEQWTFLPAEFGVRSLSQKLAAIIRASGCSGMKFRSTKHAGAVCVAIFPDALGEHSVIRPLPPANADDCFSLAQIDMSPLSKNSY